MKARIKFRKYGALRFIGHLDVMRFFQKVVRRADIPFAFTTGYSPRMIMSFANPLGIGLTSDGEYFDIELREAVNSLDAVRRMNEACVEGIEVLSIRRISDEKKMTGMTILAGADYLSTLRKGELPSDWKDSFIRFMEQTEIRILKQTKRSEKEVDIRHLIYDWEIRGDSIYTKVAAGSVENLKPDLILYVESCGSHTLLHTSTQTFECVERLSALCKRCEPELIRCHESYLVNLTYVASIQRFSFTLTNGVSIPIPEKRYTHIKKLLANFSSSPEVKE